MAGRGALIASFRLRQQQWRSAARVLAPVCLLSWSIWKSFHFPPVSMESLRWIGLILLAISFPRRIRFYQNGVAVPKQWGEVFLTREQVLETNLVRDRFRITGPDASWNGPYSGGTFQVREADVPKFEDALTRFQTAE